MKCNHFVSRGRMTWHSNSKLHMRTKPPRTTHSLLKNRLRLLLHLNYCCHNSPLVVCAVVLNFVQCTRINSVYPWNKAPVQQVRHFKAKFCCQTIPPLIVPLHQRNNHHRITRATQETGATPHSHESVAIQQIQLKKGNAAFLTLNYHHQQSSTPNLQQQLYNLIIKLTK